MNQPNEMMLTSARDGTWYFMWWPGRCIMYNMKPTIQHALHQTCHVELFCLDDRPPFRRQITYCNNNNWNTSASSHETTNQENNIVTVTNHIRHSRILLKLPFWSHNIGKWTKTTEPSLLDGIEKISSQKRQPLEMRKILHCLIIRSESPYHGLTF